MANDVERLLTSQQTGEYIPTEQDKKLLEQIQTMRSNMPQDGVQRPGPMIYDLAPDSLGAMRQESVGLEAGMAGYGTSRFDRGEFSVGDDVEDKRAQEQSSFNKILNGALKGGVIAATTAAETTLGIINGLFSGTEELLRQAATGDNISLGEAVGKGVNNWTARTMADLQRLSEEWFPNYRTTEERSPEYQDNWMRHIFTANFIGDSFLKNLGFTAGALAGGAAWSKALNAAIKAATASNLLKGVTAAASGDEQAKSLLTNLYRLVGNADSATTVAAEEVPKVVGQAAKGLNKLSLKHEMFGGLLAAMGEGTMEGVMARNEFMDDYASRIRQEYINSYTDLQNNFAKQNKGTNLVREIPVRDENGNIVDTEYELNDYGKAALAIRQRNLAADYAKKKQWAEEQGDRLAATTFLMNIPILTVSNTMQFGKMLSGGFKTARNNIAKVAGGITTAEGKLAAEYGASVGNKALRALGKSAKMGAAEATEEMLQGVVSSGAQKVADARLTSFNDDGYDRNALRAWGSEWLGTMLEGGGEYLNDWKNWQEGFLGLATGLLGMPSSRRQMRKNWSGGIIGAINEVNAEDEASRKAAEILNNEVNSERFQNAMKGWVRHQKYDDQMQEAAVNDDQYTWKTASDKQLISDIMMFANAGRLQDLNDVVDFYANMTDAQAEEKGVTEEMATVQTENQIRNNPSEAVASVKEQAKNIKDTIQMYSDMYDAMTTLAPVNTSDNQIQEMIATAMNIKAFENRFMSMFDGVLKAVEPYVTAMSAFDISGEELNDESDKIKRAKDIYSTLSKVITDTGSSSIKYKTVQELIDAAVTLEDLEGMVNASGDEDAIKKLSDMKKVAEDRRSFLDKLVTLQNLSPEQFEEEAETPEKVAEQVNKENAAKETADLKTFRDYKQRYLEKNSSDRANFMDMIAPIASSNAIAKQFIDFKNRFDGFKKYINDNGINVPDEYAMLVTQPMISSVVNDLFRRTNSENELTQLPDNAFMTEGEFIKEFTNTLGAPTPQTFDVLKKGVRDAMKDYVGAESMTQSRNGLNPSFTPQKTGGAQQTVSTPTGYDAAAPGSTTPVPASPQATSNDKGKATIRGNSDSDSGSAAIQGNAAIANGTDSSAGGENAAGGVNVATDSQLAEDSYQASADSMPNDVENERVSDGDKPKTPYYRTSVPEISTIQARIAREAILRRDAAALMAADLSDFSDDGYTEIWNALKDRNAFANVAMELSVGDEVEFAIDPSFPEFNGQPQILIRKKSTGDVLTVLSGQTSQYYGLSDLRKKILSGYSDFRRSNPNDIYIFGKTSRVWAKRPGLIDYDYSGNEKAIIQIPSYDDNAPIVFIDRNGNADVVHGSDKSAADKVSSSFNDAERNRNENKRGNLYYLAKDGANKYIPIRLGVEHFKNDNKDADIPTFAAIRKSINDIVSITSESTPENIEEQNKKLHEKIKDIADRLDIHDVVFEIGDYSNVGVALKIVNSPGTAKESSVLRRANQITESWLTDYIAELGRSLQIRRDENGAIRNFNSLVEEGLITSNARMLRPKGVDFYINPWVDSDGDFKPVTEAEKRADENTASSLKIDVKKDTPDFDSDAAFGNRDGFGDLDSEDINQRTGQQSVPQPYPGQVDEPVTLGSFESLGSETKKALISQGYTQEEFDKLGDLEKQKILKCLSV